VFFKILPVHVPWQCIIMIGAWYRIPSLKLVSFSNHMRAHITCLAQVEGDLPEYGCVIQIWIMIIAPPHVEILEILSVHKNKYDSDTRHTRIFLLIKELQNLKVNSNH
jgi:hypothetical protein